ncbi:MAG: hypothetical protein ACYDDA_05825 [Acidiferrobacteraceae bacterium]
MAKAYIINPTPLLTIANPDRKRAKKNKTAKKRTTIKHGGITMAKKKKAASKKKRTVASNPKRHKRTVAANPKRRKRVSRKRTVASNPKRHKRTVASNPRKRHDAKRVLKVNPRRRHYKRNPATMDNIGEFGKQVGLAGISFIATTMVPQYAFNAIDPSLIKNKIALYGAEIGVVAVLGLAAHHFFKKHNLAAPIILGGSLVPVMQIVAEVWSGVDNYIKISGAPQQARVAGFGVLPTALNGGMSYPAIASGVPSSSSVGNYARMQNFA